MHTRKVSLAKSISWRVIGILLLAFITYFITRSIPVTTVITVMHHSAFIVIYYLHERWWEGIAAKGKPLLKAFTYEICLGFVVLGIITFAVTGSWEHVTRITVIYLTLRYIGFPVHDRIWDRLYDRSE